VAYTPQWEVYENFCFGVFSLDCGVNPQWGPRKITAPNYASVAPFTHSIMKKKFLPPSFGAPSRWRPGAIAPLTPPRAATGVTSRMYCPRQYLRVSAAMPAGKKCPRRCPCQLPRVLPRALHPE
jgi:hypothetical protein